MDFGLTNLTENATFNPDDIFIHKPYIMEVPVFIISVLSMVANLLIIYIILKYKPVQTHVNLYILNWCFCNLFILALVPVALNVFGITNDMTYEALCLWDENLFVLMSGNLIFVAVLVIDWYIMNFGNQNCFLKCKQSAKFTCFTIWIVIVAFSFLSVGFCVNNISMPLAALLFVFTYLIVFAIVIFTHILRLVKLKTSSVVTEKNNLSLILVTSYFLCWLFNWILLYYVLIARVSNFQEWEVFSYALGYSNSMIVLYLFYKYDVNFRKCLRQAFNCKDEDELEGKDNFVTVLL